MWKLLCDFKNGVRPSAAAGALPLSEKAWYFFSRCRSHGKTETSYVMLNAVKLFNTARGSAPCPRRWSVEKLAILKLTFSCSLGNQCIILSFSTRVTIEFQNALKMLSYDCPILKHNRYLSDTTYTKPLTPHSKITHTTTYRHTTRNKHAPIRHTPSTWEPNLVSIVRLDKNRDFSKSNFRFSVKQKTFGQSNLNLLVSETLNFHWVRFDWLKKWYHTDWTFFSLTDWNFQSVKLLNAT